MFKIFEGIAIYLKGISMCIKLKEHILMVYRWCCNISKKLMYLSEFLMYLNVFECIYTTYQCI
jgi:hypothetical protein